ncbi:MAG: 3'(2'),5'-bisphosphate nucleotidase CysQ [Deltaproteobacteria bacterium]|nr:3'(2'),5'-bisphosphate nucleotidase CysQ [Deltaproteobacteria bacterium]
MISKVIEIAREAGSEIMKVYEGSDLGISYKEDESPLTLADRNAHNTIEKGLLALDKNIPIISEEGDETPYAVRKDFKSFWLVDPLDGTKEFIKKNGEFTVNIALIENNEPVLGVVYAPAMGLMYYASKGEGAFKMNGSDPVRLPRREAVSGSVRVVASRSHPSKETEEYLEQFTIKDTVYAGSSLKFCVVAEGEADIYPRIGRTSEWDTAAGQCVAEEAGVRVEGLDGKRLMYNKETLKQPGFIVTVIKS